MTVQTLDGTSSHEAETSFEGLLEFQPLVRSLQAILKQIDDEFERECDRLMRTLPEAGVKDRALAMLKSHHLARRENYVRKLEAILKRD